MYPKFSCFIGYVSFQVAVLDSKIDLVLQLLQNSNNVHGPSSEGSRSYDLGFRGNGDGVSTRRSSVSRASSDPLDGRIHKEPYRVTISTHVARTSDIPCVTLSDPESVQCSFPCYDRSHGSWPISLTSAQSQSLSESVSGADQNLNLGQSDGIHESEVGTLNPLPNLRTVLPDTRQLSDVTEESLTDSKETMGGLTPSAPISQQNSTASDADASDPGTVSVPAPLAGDVVWEKRDAVSAEKDARRKRPSLTEPPLLEAIKTRLAADQAANGGNDPRDTVPRQSQGEEEEKCAPVEIEDSQTTSKSTLKRGSPVHSEEEPTFYNNDEGHFDGSIRSAQTRQSAKRRPLVKSTPVEV